MFEFKMHSIKKIFRIELKKQKSKEVYSQVNSVYFLNETFFNCWKQLVGLFRNFLSEKRHQNFVKEEKGPKFLRSFTNDKIK